jgi:hypothetical protein
MRHALLAAAMASTAVAIAHVGMTASVGHASTPPSTNLTGFWTSSEGAAIVIHRHARWDTAAVAFVAGRLVAAAAGSQYQERTQCMSQDDDSRYSLEPRCQHWDTALASFSLYDRTSALAEDAELPPFSHGELVAMRLQGFLVWLRKRRGRMGVLWVNFESCAEDDVEEHVRRVLPMGSKGVHISPFDRSHLRKVSGMRSVLAYPCSRTTCMVFPDGPRHVRLVHQENTLQCVSERPLLVGSVGAVQHAAAMVLPEEMRGMHRGDLLILRLAADRGSHLAVVLQSKLPRRWILLVPKYRDSFLFLALLLNLFMASSLDYRLVPGASWKSRSSPSLCERAQTLLRCGQVIRHTLC